MVQTGNLFRNRYCIQHASKLVLTRRRPLRRLKKELPTFPKMILLQAVKAQTASLKHRLLVKGWFKIQETPFQFQKPTIQLKSQLFVVKFHLPEKVPVVQRYILSLPVCSISGTTFLRISMTRFHLLYKRDWRNVIQKASLNVCVSMFEH